MSEAGCHPCFEDGYYQNAAISYKRGVGGELTYSPWWMEGTAGKEGRPGNEGVTLCTLKPPPMQSCVEVGGALRCPGTFESKS